MSRASQRNAWLIQHCYSPYGTTQLKKTGKKGSFGPQKDPFGGSWCPRWAQGGRSGPNYTWLACLGWIHGHHTLWPGIGPFPQPNFIGLHSVSTSANMYHLHTRAGELPRSASSHFGLGSLSEKKTGLCGKNSQTEGGGGFFLTQTHFLMSTYQVIFGMPKWFWGAKTCFTKRGEVISDQF